MSYKPNSHCLAYFLAQDLNVRMELCCGIFVDHWDKGVPYFKYSKELNDFEKRVEKHKEKDVKNKPPEYSVRVATLLHNMCPLLLKNKSLTEELLHLGVRQLCSHLITDTRSNTEIEQYEKFVASTTDTSNPFHLIFEKYDKISAEQKEIISGILNLDYNQGRFWISDVSKACLVVDLKNDVAKQVLMEFLKKI